MKANIIDIKPHCLLSNFYLIYKVIKQNKNIYIDSKSRIFSGINFSTSSKYKFRRD